MIVAGGAAGGLALVLGFVVLLELRDRTLKSKEDVVATLSLPVLAVVPLMTTSRERRVSRIGTIAASAGIAVLALATVFAMWQAAVR